MPFLLWVGNFGATIWVANLIVWQIGVATWFKQVLGKIEGDKFSGGCFVGSSRWRI